MNWLWTILGAALAAVWLDRLRDAALGLPRVPDITQPQWDHGPEGRPKVSLIVAACNEEDHVEVARSDERRVGKECRL